MSSHLTTNIPVQIGPIYSAFSVPQCGFAQKAGDAQERSGLPKKLFALPGVQGE